MASNNFTSLDGKTYTSDEEVSAADAAHFRAQGYRPVGEIILEARDIAQKAVDGVCPIDGKMTLYLWETFDLYGNAEDKKLLHAAIATMP